MVMNPYYGDSYSYPWKRGPHDNLPEYTENMGPVFEGAVREVVWKTFQECGQDWLSKLVLIFQNEDES